MAEWYDQYPDYRPDLYDKMYENLDNGLNADGSEQTKQDVPKIGSKWQHTNGIKYQVTLIANSDSINDKYPVTVVYQGDNKKVWSRPLSDWGRSFKQIK